MGISLCKNTDANVATLCTAMPAPKNAGINPVNKGQQRQSIHVH
jgi:hypothetical protein